MGTETRLRSMHGPMTIREGGGRGEYSFGRVLFGVIESELLCNPYHP